MPIPRRIIQTDKSADLPTLSRAVVSSIKLLNPDFEYLFFDDAQVARFIDTEYPQYRPVFDRFPVPIQRYDFFRYLAVYRLGGFYFDMDILLCEKLDELLRHACVFPFERLTWSDYLRERHGMHYEIGNYAFGAESGHPFLASVIENCVKAQNDPHWRDQAIESLPRFLRDELFVIYSTGPGLVSRTFADYSNDVHPVDVLFPDDICDKKNSWNRFGDYGIHLGVGSWRTRAGLLRRKALDFQARRNEERAIALARAVSDANANDLLRPRRVLPSKHRW